MYHHLHYHSLLLLLVCLNICCHSSPVPSSVDETEPDEFSSPIHSSKAFLADPNVQLNYLKMLCVIYDCSDEDQQKIIYKRLTSNLFHGIPKFGRRAFTSAFSGIPKFG